MLIFGSIQRLSHILRHSSNKYCQEPARSVRSDIQKLAEFHETWFGNGKGGSWGTCQDLGLGAYRFGGPQSSRCPQRGCCDSRVITGPGRVDMEAVLVVQYRSIVPVRSLSILINRDPCPLILWEILPVNHHCCRAATTPMTPHTLPPPQPPLHCYLTHYSRRTY